jgi:PAS domain S-box-containing protein
MNWWRSSPDLLRAVRIVARAFLLICLSSLLSQSARVRGEQLRRILIVNEAGTAYPAIDTINQGIRKEFEDSPFKLEIYSEYLETILFPDSTTQQEFRAFILHKYHNRRPDVIITVGPSALQFLKETHKTAFNGIPVIFCLPTGIVPGSPVLDDAFTGVENDMSAGATLETALRLRPDTEHVFVVGGQSDFDKQLQIAVKQQLKPFENHLDIVYLTSLAMPDLLERLKHLPGRSVVLLTTIAQDAAGNRFKSNETGPLVTNAANAPVFSLFDTYLNHGEVGGDLSSFSLQGRIAGSMAVRILRGEKPQDIQRVSDVTNYMFDWRALRRWGLKESNLPPDSIVINRQPGFWELYKQFLVAGVLALLAQTFVILGLLWQKAKRRKSENELVGSNERLRSAVRDLRESEERFRLVSNNAPVLIWMSGVDKLCTYFNQPWLEFTGRSLAEELGDGWAKGVHTEDRDRCVRTYSQAFDMRESFEIEYRLRRHDGEYRWIVDLGIPRFAPDGSFAGYIGSCIDISERKLAQEALSTVSRRLIEAHEEERTWIARELHDDVNQRLALAVVNLDILKRELPDSVAGARRRVSELAEQTKELGNDVQALSHRLHSSKLEYLGLTAAITTFCREFSERKGVQIDLQCDAIPRTMSPEISLCLFRVLQEALQNASKHSGSQQYQVSIKCGVNEIGLTVSDSGIGFDPQRATQGRGLGITSMRERLKLVSGELYIEPRSPNGVVVRARVPVPVWVKSAVAGKM